MFICRSIRLAMQYRTCFICLLKCFLFVGWLAAPQAALMGQPLDPQRTLTQYVLQNWQQEQGLPQNSINAIVQTRDGYIWLGANEGLVRFDGVTFTTYTTRTTPALGNNGVWALLEASDGTLWIGTNGGGLVAYRQGKFTRLTTGQGLKHNTVLCLNETSDHRLWVGTTGGYCIVAGDSIQPMVQHPEAESATVYVIEEVSPGECWVGTRAGLFVHTADGKVRKKDFTYNGITPIVSALLKDREGLLWVGTRESGLFQVKDGRFIRLSAETGLVGSTVNRVFQDPSGMLWVGTFGGGLHRYKGGGFERLSSANGLKDNDVLSLWYDREGSLWFGTKRGGLYRLKNSKFKNYGSAEGMPSDNTTCVLPSGLGGMWVGFSNAGLVHFDPARNTVERPAALQGLRGSYIRAVHESSDGSLWFSVYGTGIGHYRDGSLRVYGPKDGVADIFVRSILTGPGGSLWFGTRGGLNRYANGRFELVADSARAVQLPILCMTQGRAGRQELWLGTDGQGLTHYLSGRFTYLTEKDGLNSNVVLCTYYDQAADALWIGTNAGLNLLLKGKLHAFRDVGDVFADAVLQIRKDHQGNLWLSSNHGIYQLDPTLLMDHALGKADLQLMVIKRYDQADGMRAAEGIAATEPGISVAPDGQVWFATLEGLTVVDPAHIAINQEPPPVLIERLVVDGEVLPISTGLELAAGSKVLEVKYTGLSFQVPAQVGFKYRLRGFSDTWIDADSRRSAFFTGLTPGTYTFEVLAKNNDQVWSPEPARFEFVLAPFFYQTTGFYLLIGLLLVGGVAGIVQLRLRNSVREQRRLEAHVRERTQEVEEQKKVLAVRNMELGRANESLSTKSHALQEALISLQRAQDQLVSSEKMAVLGQLVANIAHEINTPISAITSSARTSVRQLPGLLESLAMYLQRLDADETRAFLALIQAAGRPTPFISTRQEREYRQRVYQQLLALGIPQEEDLAYTLAQAGIWENLEAYILILRRPDAVELVDAVMRAASVTRNAETILHAAQKTSKIVQALKTYAHQNNEDQKALVQLSDGIETVLTIYHNQLKRGVEVVRHYEPIPQVWVYADEIEQVWTNLVSNALLAMNGHGILTITLRQEADRVVVAFQDSGVGIPEEVLPNIFTPFFTTRSKGQGSGLGLDICRKIVEKHGGTIEAASHPGRTVFTVTLPIGSES